MGRGFWVCLLALPLLALGLHLAIGLAERTPREPSTRPMLREECEFPGADQKRLIVAIIDSLRFETATDPRIMPWLSEQRHSARSGRMTPCLSQLSLLCLRTMFEGSEPLLVTGLHNFTGMRVAEPSLIKRLAQRGVHVAAVADAPFVRLYQNSLFVHATFEEAPDGSKSRDDFAHRKTFEWLADPRLDVLISHTIDTDAVAHRVGVGHPEYVAKFRRTDAFLAELASRLRTTDSLLVLGDHGHDLRGFHSTGIPAETAYVARGTGFAAVQKPDLEMADAYALMSSATCESAPSVSAANAELARSPTLVSDLPALLLLLAFVIAAGRVLTSAPWYRRLLAFGATLSLALGLLAPWLLVTLQNQVNIGWTMGFWVVLSCAILALALLAKRCQAVPFRLAAGSSAWGLIFFGLFLGPYYYGAGRNLVFGLIWLLLACAWPFVRQRRLRSWLTLAIVPLIPLCFPVLKEWESRYVLLEFANGSGRAQVALTIAGLVGVGVLLSPERRVWLRPGLALALLTLLGFWTELARATLLAASLLLISYVAAFRCVRELEVQQARSTVTTWLEPILQVSYAFLLFFVLLGSLRFANVDFRFALALTAVERGEAAAALIAIPLTFLKYLVPVGLLLAQGPRLDARALVLLACKAAAMAIFLLGMQLSGAGSLRLFLALQAQEIALCAVLYLGLYSVFVLGIGRAGDAKLVEVTA